MSKYFSLTLGIINAVCIVVNMINQNLDILVINVIACALCLYNFMND
jgi:hypothetical protein